jgi:hypothetical protein
MPLEENGKPPGPSTARKERLAWKQKTSLAIGQLRPKLLKKEEKATRLEGRMRWKQSLNEKA